MPFIADIISSPLFSLGLQIAGTFQSAQAQKQQGASTAALYEYNAKVYEQRAAIERKAATYEAAQKREEGRRLLARQLVLFAKAGVMPQTGTPLITMGETAADVERDARLLELAGRQKGMYYESEATLERMKGSAAKRAAAWSAGTTLLTGFSNALQGYYSLQKNTYSPVSTGLTSEGKATLLKY